MSPARNFTLPPLSIHTQPKQRISLLPDLSTARLSQPKTPPQHESRRPDRDTLPSMVKAATAHESSNLKMVSFAPTDGNESESSSICHSPTWDDYGKKKRKETETKRKRLTKEPPPAAMDTRPDMTPRAMTDSTLSIQQLRQCLEGENSSQQLSSTPTKTSLPLPVESVETVARSPAFIGGVRLEREREAAMKRMMNSRGSSVERPASEMILQSPPLESQAKTEVAKKREIAPATSYPPASSKTPFLKDSRPARPRRNSIGQNLKIAAGKLFSSKDKDLKNGQPSDRSTDSRASVESSQTLYGSSQDRGRQMSGSTITHSRGQSYDSHERYTSQKEERRGAMSLPPVAWKNKQKKTRTTSMIAVPPDSARDGSFSPFHSPPLKEDNFGFLERPFSPPIAPPMSPPASLSPSLKARNSPTLTPVSTGSPAWQPSSKKTFKEALKAGFRSSSATPDAKPARRRSGTLDTLVGTDYEVPLPGQDNQPQQAHSAATANGSPALSARDARRSDENPIGLAQSGVESKDSAASTASSPPDSESQVPSAMTTPEGSRPQSSKDSQAFRLDEVKRIPPLSYENVIAMRGSPVLPPAGYFAPKKTGSPRTSIEQPKGSPKDLVGRQHGRSGSCFKEDLPSSQTVLRDEPWSQSKKPLDPDQLSFTSALTSIDVKRSFADLNSALNSPNGDVTPLSLESTSKAATPTQTETRQASMGFQFGLSPKGSNTSLDPASPHSTISPRMNGRPVPGQGLLPTNEVDKRSFAAQPKLISPNSPAQSNRKASDYLQEARKAAPASPRPPFIKTSSQASLPTTNNAVSSPRAFALSKTTPPATPSTATISSRLSSQPVRQSSAEGPTPLGTPVSKVLVECCHCKFYQDMPSRVYEAMARPDDVVKDNRLGVSGQVTTCVKCPWCAHNMSTVCCAGYAAVIYLHEKLHGR